MNPDINSIDRFIPMDDALGVRQEHFKTYCAYTKIFCHICTFPWIAFCTMPRNGRL